MSTSRRPLSRLFRFSLSWLGSVTFALGCSSSEGAAPVIGTAGSSASGAEASLSGTAGALSSLGGGTAPGIGGAGDGGSLAAGSGGISSGGGAGSSSGAGSSGHAGSSSAGSSSSSSAGSNGGDKVLMIAGAMPLVGVDLQIHQVLEARGLEVQDIRETAVMPADAQGKQLIIISYSVLSTDFKAADFADVPVPLIVLDHNLLPPLGMTTPDGHGYQDNVTQITLTGSNASLNAGMLAGDVTIYSRIGEVFWGIPGPSAITAATVKGDPSRAVTFGYPAGAMMAGKVAPAKRLQLFVAVHAPPANPNAFLSEEGLKLVDAAVDWSLH